MMDQNWCSPSAEYAWAAKDALFYLNQASQFYNQGDYKQAEQAFARLIKMRVKLHNNFYYFYGKTLYHNGHYSQAEQYLGKFLKSADSDNKYYSDARYLQTKSSKNKQHQVSRKNTRRFIYYGQQSWLTGSETTS